jgi:hypothetical protein
MFREQLWRGEMEVEISCAQVTSPEILLLKLDCGWFLSGTRLDVFKHKPFPLLNKPAFSTLPAFPTLLSLAPYCPWSAAIIWVHTCINSHLGWCCSLPAGLPASRLVYSMQKDSDQQTDRQIHTHTHTPAKIFWSLCASMGKQEAAWHLAPPTCWPSSGNNPGLRATCRSFCPH